MFDTATVTIDAVTGDPTPASVLAAARERRAAADRAEADLLTLATTWADLHPPEGIGLEAVYRAPGGCEHEVAIAGVGCPRVAEFAIPELAAALGLSSTAGKRLVGHALELRHRLPRLWARVQAGQLPAWRVRRVAEATIAADLTPDAAAFVDRALAPYAHRVGTAALDRAVAEALVRSGRTRQPLDPDHPDAAEASVTDHRHVTVHDQDVAYAGTVRIEAELDLADALDLDHALRLGARQLADLGSTDSLDVRRAEALGRLARRQLALDLTGSHQTDPDPEGDSRVAARELVLHVHLTATLTGDDGQIRLDRLATVEEGQRQVLLDHVQGWCTDSHTRVTIRPVLDLNKQLSSPGHTPGPTLREQVVQRDRTCRFPWCTRPARACQVDHTDPYRPPDHPDDPHLGGPTAGSQTTSENLAALCPFHHRLKTRHGWTYAMPTPGEALCAHPTATTTSSTTPAPDISPAPDPAHHRRGQ